MVNFKFLTLRSQQKNFWYTMSALADVGLKVGLDIVTGSNPCPCEESNPELTGLGLSFY
jgi:hypothetical protein